MRLPSHLLLLATSTLALTGAVIACGAPAASDTAVSEGHITTSVRKGEEFVRCWTTSDGNADEFFRSYAVTCRVSSAGLPGLGATSVYVDARTSTNNNDVSGSPGATPDHDVVIGRVGKDAFPLSIQVYGVWARELPSTVSYYHVTVAAAETATAAAPVIVKLPFDTWPVTFLNRLPLAVVTTAAYDVDVAPFITEQDDRSTKTTFTTSATTGFLREPRAALDLIAPRTGGINVEVQAPRGPYRANLPGPGVYVLEESGLRAATPAEEAEAASASPSDADAGAAAEAAAPDAAPAPPGTTCGGPGQNHCEDGLGAWSCNNGTRLSGSSCVACGAAGQPTCFDDPRNVDGNQKCNATTRYDSSTALCLACGNDGQTYCFDDPRNLDGSWRCNAGTRYDSSTGNCIACGTAGKTYCFTDPRNVSGNATCNAGLHLDSNNICM